MKLIAYEDRFRDDIMRISLEWLGRYDLVEDVDIDILSHPMRMIENGGHIILAVTDEAEVAGMVMLDNHGDSFDLNKYCVAEGFRGHGTGYLLLDEAIRIARAEGKKKLTLSSNHQLRAALHQYEKVGFKYREYEKTNYELSDISMEMTL